MSVGLLLGCGGSGSPGGTGTGGHESAGASGTGGAGAVTGAGGARAGSGGVTAGGSGGPASGGGGGRPTATGGNMGGLAGSTGGAGASGGSGGSAWGGGGGGVSGGSGGAGGGTTSSGGAMAATAAFYVMNPLPSSIVTPSTTGQVTTRTTISQVRLGGQIVFGESSTEVVTSGSGSMDESLAFRWTPDDGLVRLADAPGATALINPRVTDVNADGSVVAGVHGLSYSDAHVFRWTASTGMRDMPPLDPSSFMDVVSLSDDGATLVANAYAGSNNAQARVLRSVGGGPWVAIDLLSGLSATVAVGASATGDAIFGLAGTDAAGEPFRWTSATGTVSLGLSGTGERCAPSFQAVTRSGGAVAGNCTGSGSLLSAFYWSSAGGAATTIQGSRASVVDISDDGSVVVTSTFDAIWRWTKATGAVSLGTLPGYNAFYAINNNSATQFDRTMSNDGSVIAGTVGSTLAGPTGGTEVGFRWTAASGMMLLPPLDGMVSAEVTGISPDGSLIVGRSFTQSSGEGTLWDATGTPHTLSGVILAAGASVGTFGIDSTVHILAGGHVIYGQGHQAGAERAFLAILP